MPQPDTAAGPTDSLTYREYIHNVRIVERPTGDGDTRYRFEAPEHEGIEFDAPEIATLYADVYFDVNGFQEAGTGERGVPPEVIQAGRDTLVAYFLTQDGVDVHWAASFYGEKPEKIERYVSRVRKRSKKIREGAKEQGYT
ncbi:hypothetical protein Har1130_07940 [Haloarcula sp. CBA1130]|uniref:hypothetical protein n=1 Tax=unclassified Haloarcula TaxID=2624677 RepID=UPI0012444051|nr:MULTISPECIES: hypothetical protein [unclassified Haloarcula]KAA9397291.1 hypothetical protein Har1129_03135 [Haloarcula sp. CBA1129]KAA9402673.1 hypothetical protein Har1130_07940 [Haloarcula sp. CBA1130]